MRYLFTFCLIICFAMVCQAQQFPGFTQGNYAGVMGVSQQPASIADNLYKWDVVLAGASGYLDNNYFVYSSDAAYLSYTKTTPQSKKTRFGMEIAEVWLPSFMLSLSNKDAIAWSNRIRHYTNVDKFTADFANLIAADFDQPDQLGDTFRDQGVTSVSAAWAQSSFTYARVLNYVDDKFLKVGASLNVILPLGSAFGQANNLTYTDLGDNLVSLEQLSTSLGYSSNFDGRDNDDDYNYSISGFTMSMDLGFVFEKRPQQRFNPTYGNSAKYAQKKRNDRPYQYRLSVALLDLGRMRFKAGTLSGQASEVNPAPIDLQAKFEGLEDYDQIYDSLATFTNLTPISGKYSVGLPTNLQIGLDYNLHKGYYINFETLVNFSDVRFTNFEVHDVTHFRVTPRYENDIFGAYLPLYANVKGQVNLGLAFRVGPVIFGVQDVLPFLGRGEVSSGGAFIALKTFAVGKNRNKKELECVDFNKGFKHKKQKPSKQGREQRNYGESPDIIDGRN